MSKAPAPARPLWVNNPVYLEQVIPEYQGNPLIEALPPILDVKSAIDILSHFPEFSPTERDLPNEYRFHLIGRLAELVQPLVAHVDVEQKISRLIRRGYICRNPLSATTLQHRHYLSLRGTDGVPDVPSFRPTTSAMALTGMSGMGKTTLANAILSTYPQKITHSMYQGRPFAETQVVWLKVDCPFDGSLKTFCTDVLVAFDDLLGTDYYQFVLNKRMNVGQMQKFLEQKAVFHALGLLAVDEIQHLKSAKSEHCQQMLNFWANLVNNIGIPLWIIGTYAATSLFRNTFRDARRLTKEGFHDFKRPAPNASEWNLLLDSVWNHQWVRNPCALTNQLRLTIYDLTQGISDVLIKLMQLAQCQAIKDKTECVDARILRKVSQNELSILQPALNALRSGKKSRMRAYEDLLPPDDEIEQIMAEAGVTTDAALSTMLDAYVRQRLADHKAQEQEQLINLLRNNGVGEEQIRNIVASQYPSQPTPAPNAPPIKKEAEPVTEREKDDLRNFSGDEDSHDRLVDAGLVTKDVMEFNQPSNGQQT